MATITDSILAAGPSPERAEGGHAQPMQALTWRKAFASDIDTAAPVRWRAGDGSWRYPTGMQADNLLHFDTARCEVLAA